ncbi:hypothetical protein [Desulfitobacterium sp. Sab5]|uniref:hypothetical protein n=1 Tax=Desulfitobacterium TaxID=36853 RepID=UPI003CF66122
MNSLYCSESRIEMLKKRAKRCVCKYCGGQLNLNRIIFNDVEDARVEIYCDNCDRIEFGIEPEIYRSARNFVDNLEFDYYEGLDQNEKKRQMNIAKISEIMAWGCKNMGILNQNGFQIALNMEEGDWDECLVMKNDDIKLDQEEK